MKQNLKIKKIENKINENLKVALIVSMYYQDLTQSLSNSCINRLVESGVKKENIKTFYAPGTWEIPIIAKKIIESKKFDGIITFGVLVKGETYHFEMIANETSRALMDISLKSDIPIAFEILVTFNLEQAKERALGKHNKGVEGAIALLKTLETLSQI